jgi:hypothetical protein
VKPNAANVAMRMRGLELPRGSQRRGGRSGDVAGKGPTTLAELENEREQLRAQREQAKQAELEKLAKLPRKALTLADLEGRKLPTLAKAVEIVPRPEAKSQAVRASSSSSCRRSHRGVIQPWARAGLCSPLAGSCSWRRPRARACAACLTATSWPAVESMADPLQPRQLPAGLLERLHRRGVDVCKALGAQPRYRRERPRVIRRLFESEIRIG